MSELFFLFCGRLKIGNRLKYIPGFYDTHHMWWLFFFANIILFILHLTGGMGMHGTQQGEQGMTCNKHCKKSLNITEG
jgi:hypothetical protein